jgi:hypothetical protein
MGGFQVTAAGKPAAVVDVSYGGLRLEVSRETNLAQAFPVELAGIGLQFDVQAVWSCPSERGNGLLCGAAIASEQGAAAHTWRAIVDRLSA